MANFHEACELVRNGHIGKVHHPGRHEGQRIVELKDVEFITDFKPGRFQHVLFDFDGTISLLREGWQSIMEPMMIRAICGASDSTPEIVHR